VTGLRIDEFDAFFTALHGYRPFAWQSRLCQTIAENGQWPESISAPTGTGKSNVVEVHAFISALYGWGSGPRVPRRLAVVVNRRGIVDAHEQRALDLQQNLRSPKSDVVARVAGGLHRLRHEPSTQDEVLALATLRGGLIPDRSWIDDPAICTIICATPDMWGSRLLFGGYGSSRQARPREAGLLAFDSVMVLDEAHLNVQLLVTARRTREILQRHPTPVPALQVVETTATPVTDSGSRSVGVVPEDVETDTELARRLSHPKPVTYHATDLWPGKRRAPTKYVDEIIDAVYLMWASTTDGTVGCVVNTVSTATQVAMGLRDKLANKPTRNEVLTWVGPMRPMDLAAQVEAYPLAFQPAGDNRVGIIVATQTIEVGVDIDFTALVTELAPGSALAQRAGRVNRLGSRETGPIVVIGPSGIPCDSGPYSAEELTAAQQWVSRRAEQNAGLTPLAVADDPPPSATARREVFARLQAGDIEAFATTSEDLAAPQELALWLRDNLEPGREDCDIVLRSNLPTPDLDALALLRATPPAAREKFPVAVHLARDICNALEKQPNLQPRVFLWHDGDISQMLLDGEEKPKAGDTLVLDSQHPIVREHTIVDYGEGSEEQATVWGFIDTDGAAVEVLWRTEDPILFEQVDEIAVDDNCDANDLQELVANALGERRQVTAGRPYEGDESGEVPWLVLKPVPVVVDDDETRQTWGGTAVVTLAAHSTAVAQRARSLAAHLALAAPEVDALESAGLHHDDGKQDRRFQRVLGARPGAARAKSGGASSRYAQLGKARAGLPRGWRHEQLSVVFAYEALRGVGRDQRDLIVRLVGTSHGWGRSFFPHSAAQLVDPVEAEASSPAGELFDQGGWEELIEGTHRRIGPWGCAYYEALLRAADCAVSKEGS
jgi:CRISPR-associated endonuclease/helicase Cas3